MTLRFGAALAAVVTIWSVHLCLSYFLAWLGCGGGEGWLLPLRHAVTALSVAATLAVWWQARRALASERAQAPAGQEAAPGASAPAASAYLTRLLDPLSIMFLFSIGLAGAANAFLVPCM